MLFAAKERISIHNEILDDNAGGGRTRVKDGPGQDPHVCAQAQGRDLIYKMTA
jgi:hypothetical protein